MNYAQLMDGFMYLALRYENISVTNLYNQFLEHLHRNNIPIPDDYMPFISAATNARNDSNIAKKIIMDGATWKPEINF